MTDELRKKIFDKAIYLGWKYNPDTGVILNKKGNKPSVNNANYLQGSVIVNDKLYTFLCHRLAWYIHNGEIADNIDHIDGCTINNKIKNLRNGPHNENMWNKFRTTKGFSVDKRTGKFEVKISFNKQSYRIGYFDCEQDARNAYLDAKKLYHINGNFELSKSNFDNRKKPKTKGYSFDKSTNKWFAQVRINNFKKYLGRYNTEDEAINAVKQYKESNNTTKQHNP